MGGASVLRIGGPATLGRSLLALLGALLLVVGFGAAPASAHASLVSSTPAANSVVPDSPSEIVLRFNEKVSVRTDGIRVLDADGKRVDKGTASASGTEIIAPVEDLGTGGYVVAWRAVSEDEHPISGSFTFSVGKKADVTSDLAGAAFSGSNDGRDQAVGAVLRGLVYLAVLGAGGAGLVGARFRRKPDDVLLPRWAAGLAWVGVVAALLQLPLQAALITGQGWSSIGQEGVLGVVLGDRLGVATALTLVGLVALAITGGLTSTTAVRRTAAVGAVVAGFGLPLTGHTRTMTPLAVGYLADFAHVLAGTVWFGGLIALAGVIRRRRADGDIDGAAAAVRTFSGWAAISVAVVAVAGTAMGWIEVGGIDRLLSSGYGKLLVAKVAVVAVVLAGAWWNRSRFVPLLALASSSEGTDGEATAASAESDQDAAEDARSPAADWGRFNQVLRFEIVGIVIALALTSVLVAVTPSKNENRANWYTTETALGEGTIEVTAQPAAVGPNELHVYMRKADGTLDTRYQEAKVKLSLASQDLPPIDATVVRISPGHFQVVSVDLPFPGEWSVVVAARIDRFTEVDAKATIKIR